MGPFRFRLDRRGLLGLTGCNGGRRCSMIRTGATRCTTWMVACRAEAMRLIMVEIDDAVMVKEREFIKFSRER